MAGHYARRSGEDPDDLLQEAWAGLLEAVPKVDPAIGSPIHYLIQRARWRVLSFIRAARLRRCARLPDLLIRDDTALAGVALAIDLAGFQASLPSPQQQAVLNCLRSGLTWREVGAALGCTSANVAYHMRQIRRRYARFADDDSGVSG